MKKWLEDFAYRVPFPAASFLLAGGLALAVALLTISLHSLRAARANPADSLRME